MNNNILAFQMTKDNPELNLKSDQVLIVSVGVKPKKDDLVIVGFGQNLRIERYKPSGNVVKRVVGVVK